MHDGLPRVEEVTENAKKNNEKVVLPSVFGIISKTLFVAALHAQGYDEDS